MFDKATDMISGSDQVQLLRSVAHSQVVNEYRQSLHPLSFVKIRGQVNQPDLKLEVEPAAFYVVRSLFSALQKEF